MISENTIKYFFHLIKASMTGIEPNNVPEGVDIADVIKLSEMHNVTTLVYNSLSKVVGTDLLQNIKKTSFLLVFIQAQQEEQLKRISAEFEKNEIPFMPLKGSVINSLYPTREFRCSGDIDIYVEDKYTYKCLEIMKSLGYETDERRVRIGMHANYHLKPYVEVEIHRALVHKDDKKWYKLSKFLLKNIKFDEKSYCGKWSPENIYIYMILHAAKHLSGASIGVKTIVDVWAFNRKYQDTIDRSYLDKILKKYNLYKIEQGLSKLSRCWFEDEIAPEVSDLSKHIISFGAFGTAQLYHEKSSLRTSKAERYKKAVFLPLREMSVNYPILNKAPFLLPVLWIYRGIFKILFARKNIKDVINKYDDVSSSSVQQIQEFKNKYGL